MSKNMEKKNWRINYTDMYGDTIHTELVDDMTADEIVQQAESLWPVNDRAVEDYNVEQVKEQ